MEKNQIVITDELYYRTDISFVALAADDALAHEIFARLHRQQGRIIFSQLSPVTVHAAKPRTPL